MSFIVRQGRALLLAALLVAGAVCVSNGQTKPSTFFTDSRNGQKYRTVTIGGKTWMAQNLNIQTGNSWCYDNNNSNCDKYGRLYDWNTAKTACPRGWHLPSREEWGALAKVAGGKGTYGDDGAAGIALKSASGWEDNGNGTDSYGFSALPGGNRSPDGAFYYVGKNGSWWTASEYSGGNAYYRDMYYNNGNVDEDLNDKSIGFSVRCRQD